MDFSLIYSFYKFYTNHFRFFFQDRHTYDKHVCAPKDFSSFAGRQEPLNCPKKCKPYRQVALQDLHKMNLAYENGVFVLKNKSLLHNAKV